MAEQAPSFNSTQQANVRTGAWGTLLLFFLLFCGLVAFGGFFGLRYYTMATVPVTNTLLLKYVPTGVLMKPPNLAVPQDVTASANRPTGCHNDDPVVCVFFTEGQRLVGRRGAGYGPVAALVLPDTTRINLHTQPDGFDIALDSYQVSRWTNEKQDVLLDQAAGYARYDIAAGQPYKHVSYTVEISPDAKVSLGTGGSYSINVPRDEAGHVRGRLSTSEPILFEVSVRSGEAIITSHGQERRPRPGDLVQVALDGSFIERDHDGKSDAFQNAEWEMIPDNDFSHFTTAQYNDPNEVSTWKVRSNDDSGTGAAPGDFHVIRTCPPEKAYCSEEEKVNYGEFRRQVGDGKPFTTGIDNPIDADVSEFTRSLKFKAFVSIIPSDKSVKKTGDRGSECPLIFIFNYQMKSPTDGPQTYRICIFTGDGDYEVDPGINQYVRMKAFGIYPFEFDLRQLPAGPNSLRDAWYIQSIRIEARGHDYLSQATSVSLVGK